MRLLTKKEEVLKFISSMVDKNVLRIIYHLHKYNFKERKKLYKKNFHNHKILNINHHIHIKVAELQVKQRIELKSYLILSKCSL